MFKCLISLFKKNEYVLYTIDNITNYCYVADEWIFDQIDSHNVSGFTRNILATGSKFEMEALKKLIESRNE